MMAFQRLALFAGAGIASLSLLLLIISIATPVWLDDGHGNTVGLFRKCVSGNVSNSQLGDGCHGDNRVTQAGLSVFGLLLLVFSIIATIAAAFMNKELVSFISLGLMYFSSMFVMSAYATWGRYSRDRNLYYFPITPPSINYTSMGYSYDLCVAAHFFLWTALTVVAFGAGSLLASGRNS